MLGTAQARVVFGSVIALGASMQLAAEGCSCSSAIERDDAAIDDARGIDAGPIDAAPIDAAPSIDAGSACTADCGAATDVCLTQHVVCAVRASDGVVVCWGANTDGQLGDGTSLTTPAVHSVCPRGDCSAAVAVIDDETGAPLEAQHVACADAAVCALRMDGSVVCWGDNEQGQLGRPVSTPMLARAARVPGLPVADPATDLVAGWWRFCVTTAAGEAWCWGWDRAGGFGAGLAGPVIATHAAFATAHDVLALGSDHSCVLHQDGTLACLGDAQYGELGPGASGLMASGSPVAVSLPGPITSVSAGYFATCAILDGVPWCWGASAYGQIGRVATTSSCECDAMPAPVPGVSALVGLWPGEASPQVCGWTASGDVVCWGTLTDYCALPGGACDSSAPIPALHGARVIASSQYTSCAIFGDGAIACFGANGNRQLGAAGPARSLPRQVCLCEGP